MDITLPHRDTEGRLEINSACNDLARELATESTAMLPSKQQT